MAAGLAGLIPWLGRRNTAEAIALMYQFAADYVALKPVSPKDAPLWKALVDASAATLHQLLVDNADRDLDWGLKRHRRRLNQAELLVLSYWMTLYYLKLFRQRGLRGYITPQAFRVLHRIADGWAAWVANDLNVAVPQAWSATWLSDEEATAARALYEAVHTSCDFRRLRSTRLSPTWLCSCLPAAAFTTA
ncbi:MAG: hypothetical protein HY329_07900 [Chloroflexi bacterium]|nr:hypothetical protein [Chloroflexota bacterium]